MSSDVTLSDLARRGELEPLEDRWLEAIEDAGPRRGDMVEALAALNKQGQADQAAALGWMWLASEKDRSTPAELLDLGRELLLAVGDSREMRQEVFRLYREVFADHPGIDRLLEQSGLAGDKSVLRALRTLEIGLRLQPGDCLLARADEHVAEIVTIDRQTCAYTVRSAQGQRQLDADQLALAYDPVGPDDFRALLQLHPDRVAQMLEDDPVPLIITILQMRQGRLDSDQLEHLLSPRFIPAADYRKWWTKARNALRRCPNVVVEGKARAMLTYHAQGRSLEDEILPQWQRTESSAERLAVVDAYFREAKARRCEPKPEMIARLHRDLLNRVNLTRAGAPAEALIEALILDRLAEGAPLPEPAAAPAREILQENLDLLALLAGVEPPSLYRRALEHIQQARPDQWPAVFVQLMPLAPSEGCDRIARALLEAGHGQLLAGALRAIPADFTRHVNALCWLWRGPDIEGLADLLPMGPRELLLQLLDHLSELPRNDATPHGVLRHARITIRAALSADKYTRFRDVIGQMDAPLASTVHRTIDRLDGLGQVVRADLLRIIVDTHPSIIAPVEKIDPWTDDRIIFCTQQGLAKHEKELNHLKNVKMPENAKAIGDAAARGDLSENSEYRFALEERDLLRARLALMQDELALGRLMTVNDVSTDEVNIGTRLVLRSADGQTRHEITILGPWEADIEQRIYNYRAPLCVKLRGLRVGDAVTLELDDRQREYRVESITNALAREATG